MAHPSAADSASRALCALDLDGQAYCWGHNLNGVLGNNSSIDSPIPIIVDGSGVLADKTLVQIGTGGSYACALDSDGQVYCWGNGISLGHNSPSSSLVPVCVHGALDGTGSALPGGCALNYKVTFDINGEPAECTGVKVASDGKSLTCTTTAHTAGWVDVTVDDGISITTLEDGYEYVEDHDGDDEEDGEGDEEEEKGGLVELIEKLFSPDTGAGGALGLVVLGEVAFIVAGIAVFFKTKEA